jgi:hypothetical protein
MSWRAGAEFAQMYRPWLRPQPSGGVGDASAPSPAPLHSPARSQDAEQCFGDVSIEPDGGNIAVAIP